MKSANRIYKTPVVTIAIIILNVLFFALATGFISSSSTLSYDSPKQCVAEEFPNCIRQSTEEEFNRCAEIRIKEKEDPSTCKTLVKESCSQRSQVINKCISSTNQVASTYGFTPGTLSLSNSYTLITSTFLHIGFAHLIMNMLVLFLSGIFVEVRISHVKYGIVYLLSGIGGDLLYTLFNSESMSPLIGASGAVYGVLGALFILKFFDPQIPRLPKIGRFSFSGEPTTRWLIGMFLMTISFSVFATTSYVAYVAHLGGLLTGAMLMLLFIREDESYDSTPDK